MKRSAVATVVGMLAEGMSTEEILADFPQLTADDIAEALESGAFAWPYMTSCASATCRSNPIADRQCLLELPEHGRTPGSQSPEATGIAPSAV